MHEPSLPGSEPHRNEWPYMRGSHGRAVEALSLGVRHREGPLLLTGPPGAGKSTVLNATLAALADMPIRVIRLNNPGATVRSRIEVTRQILGRQDEVLVDTSAAAAIAEVTRTAIGEAQVVIAVDDAQTLTDDAFDLLLGAAAPAGHASLSPQLIMAGRGDFWERPRDAESQSIVRFPMRVTLELLAGDDAADYILAALKQAGDTVNDISPKALNVLLRYSGGLPGRLNRILTASISIGAVRGAHVLTGDMVSAAIASMASVPASPRSVAAFLTAAKPPLGVAALRMSLEPFGRGVPGIASPQMAEVPASFEKPRSVGRGQPEWRRGRAAWDAINTALDAIDEVSAATKNRDFLNGRPRLRLVSRGEEPSLLASPRRSAIGPATPPAQASDQALVPVTRAAKSRVPPAGKNLVDGKGLAIALPAGPPVIANPVISVTEPESRRGGTGRAAAVIVTVVILGGLASLFAAQWASVGGGVVSSRAADHMAPDRGGLGIASTGSRATAAPSTGPGAYASSLPAPASRVGLGRDQAKRVAAVDSLPDPIRATPVMAPSAEVTDAAAARPSPKGSEGAADEAAVPVTSVPVPPTVAAVPAKQEPNGRTAAQDAAILAVPPRASLPTGEAAAIEIPSAAPGAATMAVDSPVAVVPGSRVSALVQDEPRLSTENPGRADEESRHVIDNGRIDEDPRPFIRASDTTDDPHQIIAADRVNEAPGRVTGVRPGDGVRRQGIDDPGSQVIGGGGVQDGRTTLADPGRVPVPREEAPPGQGQDCNPPVQDVGQSRDSGEREGESGRTLRSDGQSPSDKSGVDGSHLIATVEKSPATTASVQLLSEEIPPSLPVSVTTVTPAPELVPTPPGATNGPPSAYTPSAVPAAAPVQTTRAPEGERLPPLAPVAVASAATIPLPPLSAPAQSERKQPPGSNAEVRTPPSNDISRPRVVVPASEAAAEQRCRSIMRHAILEDLTNEDRTFLRGGCKASR